MNANDHSDLESQTFVNHGWESLQLFEPIRLGTTYECYVKMEESGRSTWQGSAIIFSEDRPVSMFKNIRVS